MAAVQLPVARNYPTACPAIFLDILSRTPSNPTDDTIHYTEFSTMRRIHWVTNSHTSALLNLTSSSHCKCNFYTDRSKKAELVGCGDCAVTSSSQIIQQYVLPSFSIFSAELQAIPIATQYTTQNSLQCDVYTDSLTAIQALFSIWQPHHPIVSAMRETILSQQLTLKIIRTPSYRGISSNKLANLATKEAANWQPASLEPTPTSDLIDTFRKYVLQEWNTYWNTCQKNCKYW